MECKNQPKQMTMNKKVSYLYCIAAILTCGLSSCNKDIDPNQEAYKDYLEKDKVMKVSVSGCKMESADKYDRCFVATLDNDAACITIVPDHNLQRSIWDSGYEHVIDIFSVSAIGIDFNSNVYRFSNYNKETYNACSTWTWENTLTQELGVPYTWEWGNMVMSLQDNVVVCTLNLDKNTTGKDRKITLNMANYLDDLYHKTKSVKLEFTQSK